MTEKDILDKIKAECNACAPGNFSEIENQIKKSRRNIILKISAAAAVIAVPFLSVIVSQLFKPMGPEDIKLAEVTVYTSEYTKQTDDTTVTTKPVSEKETEKSTITVQPVESQSVQSTENSVKTELSLNSQAITKKQTEKSSSMHISSTDVIPTTTNKISSDIPDKPKTTYTPSHTTEPPASSDNQSTHIELPTSMGVTVINTVPFTTQQVTVSVSFPGFPETTNAVTTNVVTTKPIEYLLSINLIFDASQSDPSDNPKSKIYEGKVYNYIVTDFDLYTVKLNYSRHSEIHSIDEALKIPNITIEDLVQAGLNATKTEK